MNPLELPVPVVVDNLLPLLSDADLASLRCVCKHAKALVEDEVLWKRRVVADFAFPPHATARMGGWFNLYRGLSHPHVYVWGQHTQGRLGLNLNDLDAAMVRDANSIDGGIPYPVRLGMAQRDVGAVVQIVAGGWSFHARTSTGKVWYWGTMNGETFAGPRSPLRDPGAKVATPQVMEGVARVEALSCGRSHAIALTADGEVLEWRAWGTVWKLQGLPPSITGEGKSIKQLEAGWSFSALLTHDGEVWIWYSDWSADEFQRVYYAGHVRESMLHSNPPGHGDQRVFPLEVEAVLVPRLASAVVQIAAGEDFLIALTEDGTLHRLDLHLPAATGEDWGALRQVYTTPRDEGVDLSAVLHRHRMKRHLSTATWQGLPAFERPQSHPDFDAKWLEKDGAEGKVGGIRYISAHFRRFVVILPVLHGDSEQTLVLLGGADGVELVPDLQARGVIKVVMGDYHYGALTQDGEILTWGKFSKGALGNWTPPAPNQDQDQGPVFGLTRFLRGRATRVTPRQSDDDVEKPTPISMPRGANVLAFDLAFAGWHSSALTMPTP